MRNIRVKTIGDAFPGTFITHVDADYPLDSVVPTEDYDADEQDWQRLVRKSGYPDLPNLILEGYDGTPHVERWQSSATVWMLFDGDEPVVQDEPNG